MAKPTAKSRANSRSESGKRSSFIARLASIYGWRSDAVSVAFSGPRGQSVRLNPLAQRNTESIRQDLDAICSLEPIEWCRHAAFLSDGKAGVAQSELFRQGEVFIQNASSFVPVLALDPQEGEEILDLAASPGGKASHIAALTGNRSNLWLNDGLPARLGKLREVTELLGVKHQEITSFPAQHADRFIEERFDRILLDAQCSGEGRVNLRRSDSLRFWSLQRVQEYGYLQQRMLNAAVRLLKPGGVLVYTTCTISPEENEAPVSALLSHSAEELGVEAIDVAVGAEVAMTGMSSWQGKQFDSRLSKALRLRPAHFFEPFFVCKLRKAA